MSDKPQGANSGENDSLGRLGRWRLVLGRETESLVGGVGGEWEQRDAALEFLYGREYEPGRNRRSDDRSAGLGESALSVPDWINDVHELFPRKTIERLEQDALERYHIDEMVTNPDLLARAEPSPTLLKAVLRTKHLMNPQVLALARDLVRKVVERLVEHLAQEVRTPFSGAIDRRRRTAYKIAKNFDVAATLNANLRHWDPARRQIVLHRPYFFSRVRRQADRWQMIIVVDESGSMLGSVIHAAVTAAIFHGIPALKTHLCIFDTNVVDLTDQCGDPVETLMKVQLGGGTDIGQAMQYAATLVDNPKRTIIVLITDFFEGAPQQNLLHVVKTLVESGVSVLGLAALDQDARPNYDRALAEKIAALGAHVGAMTPGELAEWVAEKVR